MSAPEADNKVIQLGKVREDLMAAREAPAAGPASAAAAAASLPASTAGDDGPPPARDDGLPEDCPVIALGLHGDVYYYIDALRQLREVKAGDHRGLILQSLCPAHKAWLENRFPKYVKGKLADGWQPGQFSDLLMAAAARRGVWSPEAKVRDAGCWRGAADELVWHCGDRVLIGADRRPAMPGLVDGYVYPAGPPIPAPMDVPAPAEMTGEILELLRCWAWSRPDIDPVLMLGWIGASLIGGALRWRPTLWLTGGAGSGKSTLSSTVIDALLGGASVTVSNITEASLRQTLAKSTLAALVDELEPQADSRRVDAVIELARVAASGARAMRGGQDHRAVEFVIRSCFLFSSVLVPPLMPADRSRIAILDLMPLGARPEPILDRRRLKMLGQALRRRLADAWPRLDEVIRRYQADLRAVEDGRMRVDARGADVFGTLLGIAEVLLYDDAEERDAAARAWPETVRRIVQAEMEERGSDEESLMRHLLSSVVDPMRSGARTTVAVWVHRAAGRELEYDVKDAVRMLGSYGMAVVLYGDPPTQYLAIGNGHHGLSAMLQGTHWAGRSGASAVWVQSLRRLARSIEGGVPCTSKAMWIGGVSVKAVLLPLAVVLPDPGAGTINAGWAGGVEALRAGGMDRPSGRQESFE